MVTLPKLQKKFSTVRNSFNEEGSTLIFEGTATGLHLRYVSGSTTELYYITGGSARGKKVSPKTWRISAFADARLTPYGSSSSWHFPLTRRIFEVGSTFTPPWF